jgi:phage nucleotide-binding protein
MNDTAKTLEAHTGAALPLIGGVSMTTPTDAAKRITALIWGDAGCGKTTLAATAPGRKLWFNFDPDGTNTLTGVPDVHVYDLSNANTSVLESFKNEGNPLNIKALMDQFDTFVFDSITNITDKTLTLGIKSNKGATIERPSPAAYATRNALAIRLIKNVMAATSKAKKHVIFIAHEKAPTTDEESGAVLFITIALGGQLSANVGIDFSEIWHLYQVDGRADRRICIRPARKRKPAKTRMFEQHTAEFDWKFDADNWEDARNHKYRIDTWFTMWNNSGHKLPLPGSGEFDKLYINART